MTLSDSSTNVTALVAANLTAFKFAAHVCTTTGLCGGQGAVFEGFYNTAQRDGTFVPTFGQPARWSDPSAPSQLVGRAISGSPTGTTPPTLGTRIQLVVDPQPNTTSPAGLFSPFDASAASSGGQCGPSGCNLGINPGGGSHIMHLYESGDLANTEDSLEQIEWSPIQRGHPVHDVPELQDLVRRLEHRGSALGRRHAGPDRGVRLELHPLAVSSGHPGPGGLRAPRRCRIHERSHAEVPRAYAVALATTTVLSVPDAQSVLRLLDGDGRVRGGSEPDHRAGHRRGQPGPELQPFSRHGVQSCAPPH